jgi:hypothetical protein
MTLAFAVHFFDFRNDVRVLLADLATRHKIVLLVRPEDEAQIKAQAPAGCEIRLVRERVNNRKNALWDRLFLQFGKLPKSRQNFYLMEIFKISLNPDAAAQKRALARLAWRMRLPAFLSYDQYLDNLSYTGSTDLSGIDAFFCFTDIADNYLLARLVREAKPVFVYVYSWDHPCKHIRYSKRVQYLVWNEGMAEDLVQLQGIDSKRITELGASQFGYIERYTKPDAVASAPQRFPYKYVYFGCAIGLPGLVQDELQVVRELAQALAVAAPNWRFVVRPYPVLREWHHYEALRSEPNIILDDGFRTAQNLSVADDQIRDKFAAIAHAEAFLHLGTTLGLEGCFTDTPSFLVDFDRFAADKDKAGLVIWPFVHQYQNDKYLAHVPGANKITSTAHFADVVQQIEAEGKQTYLAFNKAARKTFPVRSFSEIAVRIEQLVANMNA